MNKKLFLLITGFFLFSFSGCTVPFTDITITLPFVEKGPEVLLKETVTNMSQLQSVHFKGTFAYTGNELPIAKAMAQLYSIPTDLLAKVPSGQSVKVDGNTEGDMTFSENYRAGSTFSTNVNINGKTGAIIGEMRTIVDQMYIKVTDLPQIPDTNRTPLIQDKWIHITNLENIAEKLEERGVISNTLKDIRDEILKKKKQTSQGENDLDAIIDVLKSKRAGKRLPDENISGMDAYHYQIDITSEDAAEIMNIYASASGNPSGNQTYAGYIEQLEEGILDVWIGKKDSYLYRFVMKAKGQNKNDPNATVSFEIQNDFSKFNQPIEIETPKDAKSIDDILFNSESSGIPSFGETILNNLFETNTTIDDPDQDGLTNDQEEKYGTKQNESDSDGDGYSDGQEVQNGYNPNGSGKL